ncbi:MAG: zinc-binding dehydrogenase [Armatimonadota bacterium]|nr:zinc-binding dehydrogenase [Armatimonadota bacterium]
MGSLLTAIGSHGAGHVRRLLGWMARRLVPEAEPAAVLPFLRRWAVARIKAFQRRRGLVRGMAIVSPRGGRLWAVEQDVPLPGPGEVLVRVAASVVSPGTERAFFLRLPNAVPTYPYYPGYSLAGEVVAVGRGSRHRPGDRVALAAPHASLALAADAQVFPVPPEVPLEEAAFVQLGIIALQAAAKARIRAGESVVVLGLGLIGQLLLQCCASVASSVTAVSRTTRRISDQVRAVADRVIVIEHGGTEVLDTVGASVTFDATGAPDGIPAALRCTGRGGRIVLAGSTRGVTERVDFGLMADRQVTIIGAHISSLSLAERRSLADAFFAMLQDRRLDLATLITERVHPLEAEWFYRRLAGGADATVGAVLDWSRLGASEGMRRAHVFTPPDLAPLRRGRLVLAPLSANGTRWAEGAAP